MKAAPNAARRIIHPDVQASIRTVDVKARSVDRNVCMYKPAKTIVAKTPCQDRSKPKHCSSDLRPNRQAYRTEQQDGQLNDKPTPEAT